MLYSYVKSILKHMLSRRCYQVWGFLTFWIFFIGILISSSSLPCCSREKHSADQCYLLWGWGGVVIMDLYGSRRPETMSHSQVTAHTDRRPHEEPNAYPFTDSTAKQMGKKSPTSSPKGVHRMTNSPCVFLCLVMFSGPLMMISCILCENKTRKQRWVDSSLLRYAPQHRPRWLSLTLRGTLVLWRWSPPLCWPLLGGALRLKVLGTQTLARIVPPDTREQVGPLEVNKEEVSNSYLKLTCSSNTDFVAFAVHVVHEEWMIEREMFYRTDTFIVGNTFYRQQCWV